MWSWALLLTGVSQAHAGNLNVALHAQSRYRDHGWVAGSEVTTAGMLAALRRHPDVVRAEVFAPFAYEGLLSSGTVWDGKKNAARSLAVRQNSYSMSWNDF